VVGSRGSVIPFFKKIAAEGRKVLPVTHPEMTRFAITLDQGVNFVVMALNEMLGGEIFVPKLPSMKVVDLVPLIVPGGNFEIVGIRAGEKLHEIMIPGEESRNCIDMGKYYLLQPSHHWWNVTDFLERIKERGKPIVEAFEYASSTNDWWLSPSELKSLVQSVSAQ
jgi:UDP-N-acetylglucosamine 4,6-dehydratase/5-epimerase